MTQREQIMQKLFILKKRENFHEDEVKKNVILFLDEINTNENINGILKEILIEKKIKGRDLPSNFIPIAAANPYKFKNENDQEDNTDSLKIRGCENKQTSKLVYHVHPLPESMNTFIWDFGRLEQADEEKIVQKMAKGCCSGEAAEKMPNFHQTLIETITTCQ